MQIFAERIGRTRKHLDISFSFSLEMDRSKVGRGRKRSLVRLDGRKYLRGGRSRATEVTKLPCRWLNALNRRGKFSLLIIPKGRELALSRVPYPPVGGNNEGKGKYEKEIKRDDYLQLSPWFSLSLFFLLTLSFFIITYLKQQGINEIRFSIIRPRDQTNWAQKEERKGENNRSTVLPLISRWDSPHLWETGLKFTIARPMLRNYIRRPLSGRNTVSLLVYSGMQEGEIRWIMFTTWLLRDTVHDLPRIKSRSRIIDRFLKRKADKGQKKFSNK